MTEMSQFLLFTCLSFRHIVRTASEQARVRDGTEAQKRAKGQHRA